MPAVCVPASGRVALAEAFDELAIVLHHRNPVAVTQLSLDVVRGADELATAHLFAASVAIRCPRDRDRKRAAFARQAQFLEVWQGVGHVFFVRVQNALKAWPDGG